MNKVILMGNLTRDPDIRYTQGENSMAVARFTVAVNRRRSSQDGQREADFIACVAWRQTAEFIAKYFTKGQRIGLTGSIQTRQYTAQDGSKRTVCEVVAENVEFVERKADAAQGAPQGLQEATAEDNQDLPF